jgi:hypothetical protein
VKRGLLLVLIVLVAVLAWPAMTPGLFSGEGVRDAWRMTAETTHDLVYSPQVRQVWGRLRAARRDIALLIPAQGQRFADIGPAIERRVAPIYARLASVDVETDTEEDWWFIPPAWRPPPPPYGRRRHFRHHHHHPPPPPVVGSVPEPATWLLMIGGFGMVGFALRLRRPRPSGA